MAYTPISHVLIPMILEYIAADFGITITYTRYTLGFLLAGAGFFIGWMLDTPLYSTAPHVGELSRRLGALDALKASLKPWSEQEIHRSASVLTPRFCSHVVASAPTS